jgi:hypothetical protein
MAQTEYFDRVRVPHRTPPSPAPEVPSAGMASKMGSWTRLLMLVFGMVPLAAALLAMLLAFGESYAHLLEDGALAWLGAPMLIPFFTFAALGLYATLVWNNPRLAPLERLGWLLGMVLTAPIAIPLYWVVHVWGAPRRGASES